MKKRLRILLHFLLTSPLLGQIGQIQGHSNATVYLYRLDSLFGSNLEPLVVCDGVELTRINNGRFFRFELNPGKHTLVADDRAALELQVESGQEHFVRVELAMGWRKGYVKQLVEVAADAGKSEIQQLTLLDPVKDHEWVEWKEKWGRRIVAVLLFAFGLGLAGFMSAVAEWRPKDAFASGRRAVTVWMFGLFIVLPVVFLIYSGRLSLPIYTVRTIAGIAGIAWLPLLPIGAGLMWRAIFPKLGIVAIGVGVFCLMYSIWNLVFVVFQ